MADTHIKVSDVTSDTPSLQNQRTRRRGRIFTSVTLFIGAAIVFLSAIGYLILTSSGNSQSKLGKVVTQGASDDPLELHIKKRETEASTQQGECSEDLCLSEECIHAASHFLRFMDTTVDPCDDLYRYACGGWIKENKHQVSEDNLMYSYAFNYLLEDLNIKLKEMMMTGGEVPKEILRTKPYKDMFLFYKACRSVEPGMLDMEEVYELLKEFDQFQVGRPFDPSSWDLTRALVQLLQVNGAPFFDVLVDIDSRVPNFLALQVSFPRHFGLISELRRGKNSRHHLDIHGLKKFMRNGGRQALFGRQKKEEMNDVKLGLRPATRASKGTLQRLLRDVHQSNDPSGNLVSAGDLKEEEKPDRTIITTTEKPQTATTTTTTTTTTTAAAATYTNPSSLTTKQTPSTNTAAATTTTPTTTTTTTISHMSPLTTTTMTDLQTQPSAATTTTNTTTNTTQDESSEDKQSTKKTYMYQYYPWAPVSRRVIYDLFQAEQTSTRIESLTSTLHTTFPNATVNTNTSFDGDVSEEEVYSEAMTRFLTLLQKLLPSDREKIEIEHRAEERKHFTVSKLQQLCPVIDWSLLLGTLVNKTLTEEHNIYVHYLSYFTSLCSLLDNTDPWVLHYALLTLYSYDVLQETVYIGEGVDRDKFCFEAVTSGFGEVMSNLYLHHIGNETLEHVKTSASSFMEALREEVDESFAGATWLLEEEKERVREKLANMRLEVGGMDKHWDIEYVNKSHEELNLPVDGSFLQIVMEMYKTYRKHLYALHDTYVDILDYVWSYTVQPYEIGAYFAEDINTVVIPEAFFYPPFYRRNVPNYLNFGSTAVAMGHEIFHAFDLLAIKYESEIKESQPVSESLPRRLNATADCYYDLVNESFYEVKYMMNKQISFEIDNTITRNENLADISGLRAAFRSYRRIEEKEGIEPRLPALPLTPHQLFFVSLAQVYCSVNNNIGELLQMELDEHLPDEMRINGMMKNSPEFATAFNCSSSSRMFSSNTCNIF